MDDKALPTQKLLALIQQNFYTCESSEKQFYADRRMLLYALSWPGKWLEQRGLPVTAQRYERLLAQRLKAIAQHGDRERYQRYFPAYLLKCLQDWFACKRPNSNRILAQVLAELSVVVPNLGQLYDPFGQNRILVVGNPGIFPK